MEYPREFNRKIPKSKINVDIVKTWIHAELTRAGAGDDEIMVNTICNLLDESEFVNIKRIMSDLTGILESKERAKDFAVKLFDLCIEAADSDNGVPKSLIESKKAELEKKQREESERAGDRREPRGRYSDRPHNDRYRDRSRSRSRSRHRDRSRSRSRHRDDYDRGYRSRHADRDRGDSYRPGNYSERRRRRSPSYSPRRERRPARSRTRSPRGSPRDYRERGGDSYRPSRRSLSRSSAGNRSN